MKKWVQKRRKFSSQSQITVNFHSERDPLKLGFGQLARFADGSCVGQSGQTSVLVTAVSRSSDNSSAGSTFVPLTVDYRQKAAAAGRIPTNFLRREMGPTEKEILTARVIDRSLRPLFPKGYGSETQLVANLLAVDGTNDPDVVALNAASAALAMSDIPWNGPVGAVRVGCLEDNRLVINPTRKERMDSSLNLVVAGTEAKLTVMLEAEAGNIDRGLLVDAVSAGLESCRDIASAIRAEVEVNGRPKRNFFSSAGDDGHNVIMDDVKLMCEHPLRTIYKDVKHDKISRDRAAFSLRDSAIAELKKTHGSADPSLFYEAFNKLSRNLVAELVLDHDWRVDGRSSLDLRPIGCQVDLHKPLHGSALFQRGQTQVLCTVALDSLESALKSDAISVLTGGVKEKNFFLHYEFPPYATNEIGKGGYGRREMGHGALAEKGLRAVIPKDYPFTIRLTSEVLESNGSSSMASICGGSMALMDAGVPISLPAAGVAVGLVSRGGSNHHHPRAGATFDLGERKVLVDILGLEDFLGDMDFKLAGTRSGITALQADIKLPGLPFDVVEEAVHKGHAGICQILDIMGECISEPQTHKPNWPVTEKLAVPLAKRGRFLGPGAVNLKSLMANTGVQVTPDGSELGSWNLFAPNAEAMSEAKEIIDRLLSEERVPELEFGAIYRVKILELLDRGVMVQIHPEMQPVLINNSQLDAKKVLHPSVLGLEVGQEIQVKYYGRDPVSGGMRLSRKALTVGAASAVKRLQKSASPR